MTVPSGTSDAGVQDLLREAYSAVANGDPAQALRLVLAILHATGGQAAAAPALNRVLTHLTTNNQSNALQELTELFARAASVRSEELSPPHPSQSQDPSAPQPAWREAAASGWLPSPSPHAAAGSSDSMSCSNDAAPSASLSMDTEGAGGGVGGLRFAGTPAAAGIWAGGGGAGGSGRPGGGSGGGGGQEATSAWLGPGSLGPQPQAPILSETGREGFMECALQDGSSYVCGRCRGVVLLSRRQQHEQFWCQGAAGPE